MGKKKAAGKPPGKKPPGRKRGRPPGKKKDTKFAPEQTTIDDDIDPRFPALDTQCQIVLSADDDIRNAKGDREEAEQKIKEMLKEHELRQYTVNGIKFYINPGVDSVKHEKVKQAVIMLALLLVSASYARAQYPPEQMPPMQGPERSLMAPPQDYGRQPTECRRQGPQPTVCCKRIWNPYAYSRWHWDECCCCWVICWYGDWVLDCKRPCNQSPCGGGPWQTASYP